MGVLGSGPVAGGLSSAATDLKKVVEAEGGRRVCDFMIGLRSSMAGLLCRRERTCGMVMCGERVVEVLTSVEALRTWWVVVSCGIADEE